ncbi:Syntaxin 6, N-terminal [Olea europaea subsp. europaea]|nr:Syntaxin 6, N-terminal [Olea europaea subsp. europaea]
MESTYRTWIRAKKDSSAVWNSNDLHRDLQTALATAKWQLEEFERAVNLSYSSSISADDAKDRHRDFIHAIESRISEVESSLNESTVSQGKVPVPLVQLNEGERNELALFLCGPPQSSTDKIMANVHSMDQGMEYSEESCKQSMPECLRNSANLMEWGRVEAKEEKLPGHRRTASASADIGSWNIAVSDGALLHSSSSELPGPPPRKIPSFSGLLNTMESSVSKLKCFKNGYRKLNLTDHHQEADNALPQTQNLTRGINVCYEKSKSCLDGYDDYYDKQLYGWYGAIQRQVQRSQYQMQYSRPVQVALSTILLLCLIVLFALCAV